MAKVVILGAGLTGLSCAYHLEKNNFFDYKIFERDSQPGGLCKSVEHEGFTFDYTGHLIHVNDPYFKSFLEEVINLEKFNLINRRSFIYSSGIYTPYPFQTNLFGLPTKVVTDCIEGFVKRKSHIRKPKNFYEWTLKYFGSGIGKHFMFPYNRKILSYDVKKVTPSWTGRFVPKTTLKSLIEGAIGDKAAKVGYNSSFYYPKAGGIALFPNSIARRLQNKIQTNHNVEAIDIKNKIVYFDNGNFESYKKLITTLPLDTLLKKIKGDSSSSLGRASSKLICNSVINFNLGVNVPEVSNKHWIYFPTSDYEFYRVGFWSNFSSKAAPIGASSLYGEISYLPGKKSEKELAKLTSRSIDKAMSLLGLGKENILTTKVLRLNHAYVIYDHWREKNLEKLIGALKTKSIISSGRFGEWKYSSMQEAILDGKKVAEQAVEGHLTVARQPAKKKQAQL